MGKTITVSIGNRWRVFELSYLYTAIMFKSINTALCLLLSLSCTPVNLSQEDYQEEEYKLQAIEFNNRARINAQYQRYESALMLYDKAIELDERYYNPHLGKRSIYVSLGEYEKALQESEMVIKKKPDLAEEWAFSGMLHEWLGDSVTAFQYYQKSIELYDDIISDPENSDEIARVRFNRAMSFILLGEDTKGREELKKIKDENPDLALPDELINIKSEYMKWMLAKDEK